MVEVDVIGRLSVKRRVSAPGVIEGQITADRCAGFADKALGSQENLLVFDRAPQAFDENIVPPGAAAVHADCDLIAKHDAGEGHAGGLAALVGVEDVGRAKARQRFLQCLDAKVRLQRDRQPPRQNPPAEPVDDGDEIDEAPRHRDVRDDCRPDLVGPRHRQLAQQIGIDLMRRLRLGGVWPSVDRLDRHLLHKRRHMQATYIDAVGGKQVAQHTAAREREVHMQLVEAPHDGKVGIRGLTWQIVDVAPADPQLPRLPGHRQRVRSVDHRFALGNNPALPSAPDKKSFTNVNSPILSRNVFTSIAGSTGSLWLSDPKTAAVPSISCPC